MNLINLNFKKDQKTRRPALFDWFGLAGLAGRLVFGLFWKLQKKVKKNAKLENYILIVLINGYFKIKTSWQRR